MSPTARLSDDSLAIFLFHGVVEKSSYPVRNYTRKHLEKDYFYQLIKILKQAGHPLSMNNVIEHHQQGEPFPPRAFAITFDDGFENNYSVAAPILSDLNVPATFYVTTGFIEDNEMSWIDRIEYCLENTPAGELSFPWTEQTYPFQTVAAKIRLLEYLRGYVKRDASIDLEALVSAIFEQCGLPEIWQSDDPLDLKMSWDQVQELHRSQNFIVGGHTHRHKILAFLSSAELETEVKTSVDLLAQKADIHPRHYSYPEGLAHCYSDEVIKVLMNYGICCCPTAIDGVNHPADNLFHLKRIAIVG